MSRYCTECGGEQSEVLNTFSVSFQRICTLFDYSNNKATHSLPLILAIWTLGQALGTSLSRRLLQLVHVFVVEILLVLDFVDYWTIEFRP